MDSDFWHERWSNNQIGFHNDNVNQHLKTYWKQLNTTPDDGVFVPLCGKSKDLVWLHEQDNKVVGIELSPVAVNDFFDENDLQATTQAQGKLSHWQHKNLSVLQGDFFDLTEKDVNHCKVIYDRAALIALPPEMRVDYVNHLNTIFPNPIPVLLITLEYDQSVMQGPPFSVKEDEVNRLFEKHFTITLLHEQSIIDRAENFQKRGLKALLEKVYLLNPIN